jgi:outer membrane protein TolC
MATVVEAEKAYWTYYSVIDKIQLLEQYEILLDTLYQTVSTMIAVQMATDNELLKITSRQGNIRYQMQKAKNGMALARMQLCRMIGVDMDTEIILTEDISTGDKPAGAIPVGINSADISSHLAARPEYRMLQMQVDLKDLNMKMVRGDYLPTVGLMAGYFYMGRVKMDDMTMRMIRPMPAVMVSLSIPIFHFGEGAKKVESARIARSIQQEELVKTGNLLTIEMQHATRNLQDAFLLISISEKALEEAQANLNRTRDNYELGLGTLLDVLDAQVQWQEASSHTIDARVQYKISEVEYLRVSGKM